MAGDGYLTADELKATMMNFGERVSDADIQEIIRGGDADHDGKLSFAVRITVLCLLHFFNSYR